MSAKILSKMYNYTLQYRENMVGILLLIFVKSKEAKSLKNMQKSGAEIIDVRSKTEYNEGHLEGAINIPEYELKSNFKNLNIDKNKVIVLYCISGSRSKRAYFKLKQMGYSQVYNLYGGLEEY